jgi:hypothetical protein
LRETNQGEPISSPAYEFIFALISNIVFTVETRYFSAVRAASQTVFHPEWAYMVQVPASNVRIGVFVVYYELPCDIRNAVLDTSPMKPMLKNGDTESHTPIRHNDITVRFSRRSMTTMCGL